MLMLSILRPVSQRLPCLVEKVSQIRQSSYKSSLFLEDINPPARKYTVTKDPIDWEYVKQALPKPLVPEPIKKDHYPSGWKPQTASPTSPYFVERSKNHMIPCYLKISSLKTKKTTVLKRIKGDIFLLEKEMKEFLSPQFFQPIRSQVNEFTATIRINGDYVNAVRFFLEKKGF